MTFRKKLAAFTILASVAAISTSSQASVLYTTGFDAPTYTDGALVGQDAWAQTGTTTTNPIAVTNTSSDGVVSLTTSGQDASRPFTAADAGTSSLFAGLDLTVSAAQTSGDYFFHFAQSTTNNFYGRLFARSAVGGFQLALGTSSGTPASTAYGPTLLNNVGYRVVVQYDVVDGAANDTGAIYIDPTGLGAPAPYVIAVTQGTDATGISSLNAIALRQGSASAAPSVTVDDITVATTFAEAAVVPEPASLGLLSLAGLAALRRRRA